MSVTAFRLQNFMGFEDTEWIELKPITLFFGCNSTGKSAVLVSWSSAVSTQQRVSPASRIPSARRGGVTLLAVDGFEARQGARVAAETVGEAATSNGTTCDCRKNALTPRATMPFTRTVLTLMPAT